MCIISLEPCQVWRETTARARKTHTCDCCGGRISYGDRYTSHFSVFDGEATYEKMCAPCLDVATHFQKLHRRRGTPGSMRPLLEDCIADEGDDSLAAATWRLALDGMNERRARRDDHEVTC